MILEALYRLAGQESLIDESGFEVRPVAWLIELTADGTLRGIRGTHSDVATGRAGKSKPVAKSFRIPARRTGKSGIKAPPDFLVENAKYIFGVGTADKSITRDEGAEKSGWFRDDVVACAATTGDAGMAAVGCFLARVAADRDAIVLPPETKSNDLFAFVVNPDVDVLVHERRDVAEYWRRLRRERRQESGGDTRRCMVTGEVFTGAPLFRLVKGVPGAASSGAALVSFNSGAFESYGWSNNENAPIAEDTAEACSVALQRLLSERFYAPADPTRVLPRRHVRLDSQTAVAFWSDGLSQFTDILSDLLAAEDPARVGDLYRSLWFGRPIALDDAGQFYGLIVSGAQGRIVVRDWFTTTISAAMKNVAGYFRDLRIVRNTRPPKGTFLSDAIPLKSLLGSLAPFGAVDDIPSPLAAALISAALQGHRYPGAMLTRALERMRAEVGRTDWSDSDRRDARVALIKAVLIRNHHLEVAEDMDPTITAPGYLLGRLMATIERLQQVALGDVNASVVDRYFGAASATPRAVFTRLLRSARHHARKAQDDNKTSGTGRWLDNIIDGIVVHFDVKHNGFPAHLDLVQQGMFMLGYHQQRHYLWMSKSDRDAWTAAHPDVTPIAV
jgi:CRISPR-associated protein Csd1